MDLVFDPKSGSQFLIEAGFFDTILEIKEKIEKERGIPVPNQTLIFKGNVLPDDLNIHHSDIVDFSCIRLLLPGDEHASPSNIRLLLKMPASKTPDAVEMDISDTVANLKEKINKMEGVPTNRLSIRANGVELADQKTMQDCELSHNSDVEVVVRPPPPPPIPACLPRMLKVFVLSSDGKGKVSVEVNPSDNAGELRKKLVAMKAEEEEEVEEMELDLPPDGFFFIHKQNVMDDDKSFRWHGVHQGDIIEIFGGSVSSKTN
ncbi:uncharacterized protein LOC127262609 [Andrographis paniculata]|uniref:uncharacterized protein LOC127262609 n=1 Tax=Andrographis paniculata TaxID=175694 RepID=UPI0021E7E19A|nr:uncharacterized protein LOC127262609 [Andrographis paniculata]